MGAPSGAKPGQQSDLAGLDLQREIFRVDAALGEAAGDEPEAGLRGARIHVAQFLVLAKSPDRADAVGDLVAEQFAHQMFLALVAGRQHDQIGGKRLAAGHPCAFRNEFFDIGKLPERDIADDQIGTADVEIIAAAAGEIFELPAGAVFAEIELEADALQPIEQRLVEFLRLFGQEAWLFRARGSGIEVAMQVAVLERRPFVIERVGQLRARLDIDDQASGCAEPA